MTVARIMADDLTGALDAASQFAHRRRAVRVFWEGTGSLPISGSYAFDTETRESEEETAVNRVSRASRMFGSGELCFKKVDSLLRGNSAAEIATCFARGGFRSAIVAPAFAAQQRITRGGRQYYRDSPKKKWRAVTCDLATALREWGAGPCLVPHPDRLEGRGLFICDAESDDDLAAIVGREALLEPPVLWCGSAGLAMALMRSGGEATGVKPRSPLFLVIGSDAPNSLCQVAVLKRRNRECVVSVRDHGREEGRLVASKLVERLSHSRAAALVFEFAARTPRTIAGRTISRVLGQLLPCLPRPGSVLVSGGETLHRLCRAAGATSLSVVGDLYPGVPVSRFRDGAWKNVALITKSGAFGDRDMLCDAIDRFRENFHGGP